MLPTTVVVARSRREQLPRSGVETAGAPLVSDVPVVAVERRFVRERAFCRQCGGPRTARSRNGRRRDLSDDAEETEIFEIFESSGEKEAATMIDKPVEGVTTDARPHPAGRKGAKISLKEVAERAWKARMSPRLRAWVTQELEKCGSSTSNRRSKVQCILDAFRAKVPYISDPVMGEFMGTPDQVLCLDEGGLCIVGADCDESTITTLAAVMSIGIPAMVIGSSHKEPLDVPTHVFGAFEDESGRWVKFDGTTKYQVGRVPVHMREWWVEPGAEAKERGEGDFVGMSGHGTLSVPVSMLDLRFPGIR